LNAAELLIESKKPNRLRLIDLFWPEVDQTTLLSSGFDTTAANAAIEKS
jgi:hypothetical protein